MPYRELESSSILVVGAQPCVAELGMGGSICRLVDAGYRVHLCVAGLPAGQEAVSRTEASGAARLLGVSDVVFLPFAAERLAAAGDALVTALTDEFARLRPHSIFTHWRGGPQPGHARLTDAVVAANAAHAANVFLYEQGVDGEMSREPLPANFLVDIEAGFERKLGSIRLHKRTMAHDGDWLIEQVTANAIFRGNRLGRRYAEAFDALATPRELPAVLAGIAVAQA